MRSTGWSGRRAARRRRAARLALLVAAGVALAVLPGSGDAAAGAPLAPAVAARDAALDRTRFIGVGEIRPGMRGRGRTTFSPRGIEEFDVEVLGVLRNWSPGGDLIVIEAHGGPLAETGIYRGMSGSPVYLDGRLAGAIAYNLGGFAERPIAGVTPIGQMLDLLAGAPIESPLPGGGSLGASPGPGSRLAAAGTDLRPIATPLILAGFTAQARAAMSEVLAGFGVEGVSGGASGSTGTQGATGGTSTTDGTSAAGAPGATALAPGSLLGVQLVRGDVEATALGTITHVDGDRVLAFGHPMFQAGAVDLPMTTAEVLTVYPSQNISFVIGRAALPVGHITRDQLAGIAGRVGPESSLVPMTVRIHGLDGATRDYGFEIVRNKFFLSQFVGILAVNSFTAEEKAFGDATLDLDIAVDLADSTRLRVRDVIASAQAPASLAEAVSAPVTALLFNDLPPVDVRRVAVEIRTRPEIAAAEIDEVIVDREEIEPGESIRATVFLNPRAAPRRAIELTIPVPADAEPGPALLRFCSADEAARFESERAPRRFAPADLAQLVTLVEEGSGRQRMRVTLHGDARGVVVDGREMQGLPGSVFRIMDSNRRTGGRSGSWGRLLHEEQVTTDYQLDGCQEMHLEIKEQSAAAGGRR